MWKGIGEIDLHPLRACRACCGRSHEFPLKLAQVPPRTLVAFQRQKSENWLSQAVRKSATERMHHTARQYHAYRGRMELLMGLRNQAWQFSLIPVFPFEASSSVPWLVPGRVLSIQKSSPALGSPPTTPDKSAYPENFWLRSNISPPVPPPFHLF